MGCGKKRWWPISVYCHENGFEGVEEDNGNLNQNVR
jgi:hypothetical protein